MNWKKDLLLRSALYVIIDREVSKDQSISDLALQLRTARVGVVQLRDKVSSLNVVLEQAKELSRIFNGSETLFIVNDYVDIALRSGADGVHIGQSDCGLQQARELLGTEAVIGVSCSNLSQAINAQSRGADYLGVGPVFPTATKKCSSFCNLELFSSLRECVKLPFFAIGGINLGNLAGLKSAGIDKFAVCSAVCSAVEPREAALKLIGLLKNE